MRYFLSVRANRPLEINGRKYTFEPVAWVAGNFHGVLAADGEAEADLLQAVQRRLAVEGISEEDYNILKKKPAEIGSLGRSSTSTAQPRAVATRPAPVFLSEVKGQIAESAESGTQRMELKLSTPELLTPEDCTKVERVNPPQPFVDPAERIGNPTDKKPRKRKAA